MLVPLIRKDSLEDVLNLATDLVKPESAANTSVNAVVCGAAIRAANWLLYQRKVITLKVDAIALSEWTLLVIGESVARKQSLS
jgi:hypothetical protein